jgi:hypothetical protein
LLAGYVQDQLNSDILDHVYVVPFPQSNSIELAFSQAGDVLQTTLVVHPDLLNDLVSITGAVHINDHVKSCLASSQSIFSSFTYIHAKLVLLS